MSATVTGRGADLGAPSGVVFDAETEAQLAGIDPVTAAAIRSIARQLAEAVTAYSRGYANGYVDGVRERLGVPAMADTAPPAVDPTVAERFLDAAFTSIDTAYDAIEVWSAKATTPGRSHVDAGHDAVKAIDDTISALQDARTELVAEVTA